MANVFCGKSKLLVDDQGEEFRLTYLVTNEQYLDRSGQPELASAACL